MNKTRQIIDDYKKEFPEFQYYHSVIDKIEENVEKMPDVTIESCKALFEGISKTILKRMEIIIKSTDSPSILLRKTLVELSKYSKIDETFIQTHCGFINRMSEIRNASGDISHGRPSPKDFISDKNLSEMVTNITDSMMYYLLNIYFSIGILDNFLKYENNSEFNDYLDSINELEGISYSQALFEQDLVSYKEQFNDYLPNEEEVK